MKIIIMNPEKRGTSPKNVLRYEAMFSSWIIKGCMYWKKNVLQIKILHSKGQTFPSLKKDTIMKTYVAYFRGWHQEIVANLLKSLHLKPHWWMGT